ncbi:RNA polymerase sigma factor, partial [Fibrobacterota bacterium]
MAELSEKHLVRDLKAGSLEALEHAYGKYAEKILNQGYRILLSREAAEDVLHDIYVNLFRRIRNFRGKSSLGTWLYRVTHNLCLEKIRKEKNRRRILSDNTPLLSNTKELDTETRDL